MNNLKSYTSDRNGAYMLRFLRFYPLATGETARKWKIKYYAPSYTSIYLLCKYIYIYTLLKRGANLCASKNTALGKGNGSRAIGACVTVAMPYVDVGLSSHSSFLRKFMTTPLEQHQCKTFSAANAQCSVLLKSLIEMTYNNYMPFYLI